MSDNPMLERIRKLLAKAENTNSEAEANTFFAKAQELMEKYAIAEAEVRAHTPHSTKPITISITIEDSHVTIANAHIQLISRIAMSNRCVTWYPSASPRTRHIAGFESDVRFVELLYHSIIVQMDRALLSDYFNEETQRKAANHELTLNHPVTTGSFRKNAITADDPAKLNAIRAATQKTFRPEFIAGYVERVCQRIREAEANRESTRENSMALVLRNTKSQVDDYLQNDLGLRFTTGRSTLPGTATRNQYARTAGAIAANSANLNQPSISNTKGALNS